MNGPIRQILRVSSQDSMEFTLTKLWSKARYINNYHYVPNYEESLRNALNQKYIYHKNEIMTDYEIILHHALNKLSKKDKYIEIFCNKRICIDFSSFPYLDITQYLKKNNLDKV